MKLMKWIAISLMGLLAIGAFTPLPAVDEARQAYNKMVEESVKEANQSEQEKENDTKAAGAKAQSKKDSALSEKIEAERTRIEAQMDEIRNRGMGGGFTEGMKDNLLKPLQDKLDLLTSDPKAYFQGQ